MFNYIWPISLVVISNVFYNICAKSTPETMNPFASLTITYLIAMLSSIVMFFITNRGGSLVKEYSKLSWASLILGLSVVGLEVGMIYAFRAGWSIGTTQIVQASIVAIILIVVGALIYKETFTWNKIVGIIIALVGLVFINIEI